MNALWPADTDIDAAYVEASKAYKTAHPNACNLCGGRDAHWWDCDDGPVMAEKRRNRGTRAQWDDPYARGKAEDAELDTRIGERWGGEQP